MVILDDPQTEETTPEQRERALRWFNEWAIIPQFAVCRPGYLSVRCTLEDVLPVRAGPPAEEPPLVKP